MTSSQKIQKAKCQNLHQSPGEAGRELEEKEGLTDPEEKQGITPREVKENPKSLTTPAPQSPPVGIAKFSK